MSDEREGAEDGGASAGSQPTVIAPPTGSSGEASDTPGSTPTLIAHHGTQAVSSGTGPTLIAGAAKRSGEALGRGDIIGRYLVLERLGAGGMGEVFAAHDPELDRRVALKLLHRTLDGDATLGRSRLIREAQAMAKLAHPNVIAIHDVGTVDGQIFIAMELVEGETLSDWLARVRPAWPAIVEVFLAAGRGLEAAHAVGLIHRDFKPDNVLIGRDGRARVGDFGLARTVSDEDLANLAATSLSANPLGQSGSLSSLTLPGSILGTPAYMAPEQHLGAEADARSDVFAFAVSLYEALYGRLPFTGDNLGALVLAIVEPGPPPPPPAGSRVPRALWKIVQRGLAKEPDDRYPSITALLADLAVDPRKRRRRGWLAACALATVTVVGGGLWERQRSLIARCDASADALVGVWDEPTKGALVAGLAAIDRPYIASASARVLEYGDRYAAAWTEEAHTACVGHFLEGTLDDDEYALERRCLDYQLARFADLRALLTAADDETAARSIDAVLGLRSPGECANLDAIRLTFGALDDPAVTAEVEAVRRDLVRAEATVLTGRLADAKALADDAAARARVTAFMPLIAEAEVLRGTTAVTLGLDDADEALQAGLIAAIRAGHDRLAADAAIATARRLDAADEDDEANRWIDLADAWIDGETDADISRRISALRVRSHLARSKGDLAEADALLVRGLALAEALDTWSVERIALKLDRAQLHTETFDFALIKANADEALALADTIYGPDHPSRANALSALGISAMSRSRLDEAEDYHRRALEIRLQTFGQRHNRVAQSMVNLALVLQNRGDGEAALTLLKEARAVAVAVHGEEHSLIATIDNNLGTTLKDLDRFEESLVALRRALDLRRRLGAPRLYVPTLNLAMSYYELGHARECSGDQEGARAYFAEALLLAREAADQSRQLNGPDHLHTATTRLSLGLALAAEHQWEESLREHQVALDSFVSILGEDSPQIVQPHLGIGRALRALGRPSEAKEHVERALAQAPEEEPGLAREIKLELARVLWDVGDTERARELAQAVAAAARGECNYAQQWLDTLPQAKPRRTQAGR